MGKEETETFFSSRGTDGFIIIGTQCTTDKIADGAELYQITEEDIPEDLLTELFFAPSNEDDSYKNTTMGFTGKILRR